jgi:hypothetical protein
MRHNLPTLRRDSRYAASPSLPPLLPLPISSPVSIYPSSSQPFLLILSSPVAHFPPLLTFHHSSLLLISEKHLAKIFTNAILTVNGHYNKLRNNTDFILNILTALVMAMAMVNTVGVTQFIPNTLSPMKSSMVTLNTRPLISIPMLSRD